MDNDRGNEKTILLGTDFGPGSERALTEALRMAELLAVRLQIVHVCHTSLFSHEGEVSRLVRMSGRLAALQARAAERVSCETYLRTGDPLHGLLGAIRDLRPNLVIIGSNGHGELHRVFFGSLSEQLPWRSPVRVMIVQAADPPAALARAPEAPYVVALPTPDGVGSMLHRPPVW